MKTIEQFIDYVITNYDRIKDVYSELLDDLTELD